VNAEDEVRHCRERIKDLEGEIYLLKMQLKNEKDRANGWQKAYDNAMTYAKDLLKGKK
jgi:predicted  nucleic acid-binding Zn-ribbon protein